MRHLQLTARDIESRAFKEDDDESEFEDDQDEGSEEGEAPEDEGYSDDEEFAEVKTWTADLMGDAEDRARYVLRSDLRRSPIPL